MVLNRMLPALVALFAGPVRGAPGIGFPLAPTPLVAAMTDFTTAMLILLLSLLVVGRYLDFRPHSSRLLRNFSVPEKKVKISCKTAVIMVAFSIFFVMVREVWLRWNKLSSLKRRNCTIEIRRRFSEPL